MGTGAQGGSRLMRCGREDTTLCSDGGSARSGVRAHAGSMSRMNVNELLLDDDRHQRVRLYVDKHAARKAPLRVTELQSLLAGLKSAHRTGVRADQFVRGGSDARAALRQARRNLRPQAGRNTDPVRSHSAGSAVPAALAGNNEAMLRFLGRHDDGPRHGLTNGYLALRLYYSLLTGASAGFGDNAYIHLYRFSDEIDGVPTPGQHPLAGIDELPLVTAPAALVSPAIAAVPEPAAVLLMAAGLVGLCFSKRARASGRRPALQFTGG
jgi:hypothetical protein